MEMGEGPVNPPKIGGDGRDDGGDWKIGCCGVCCSGGGEYIGGGDSLGDGCDDGGDRENLVCGCGRLDRGG